MSQTLLVTGAAGFIGSHLAERLVAEGNRVIGVDNFSPFYPREIKQAHVNESLAGSSRFQLIEADIRDRDSINSIVASHKPDTVVHLAAMAGVRPSIENPALYVDVNVGGTLSMLDAAVHNQVKKFVFASSSSVYGNNEKVPFAEIDRVDAPISPYAASKRSAELLCHTYWSLYGLPVTCLRFFTVFGPRQRPDLAISKFLRAVANGDTVALFGDGSSSRDYTYIGDIIDGVCAAIDKCAAFGVFNLGGNHPVQLRKLLEEIEACVGKKANVKSLPMQSGDVDRTYADLERSSVALGYRPQTGLAEGLAKQWQWMQSRQPGQGRR